MSREQSDTAIEFEKMLVEFGIEIVPSITKESLRVELGVNLDKAMKISDRTPGLEMSCILAFQCLRGEITEDKREFLDEFIFLTHGGRYEGLIEGILEGIIAIYDWEDYPDTPWGS